MTHNSFPLNVYFDTLHISSNHMFINRRINCINTTSGICHSYVGDSLVCKYGWNPYLHTRRSPTQGDISQMSCWYNWFSWWCAHGCSKHVDYRSKHIRKIIVRQVGYLQEQFTMFTLIICLQQTLICNLSHKKRKEK